MTSDDLILLAIQDHAALGEAIYYDDDTKELWVRQRAALIGALNAAYQAAQQWRDRAEVAEKRLKSKIVLP